MHTNPEDASKLHSEINQCINQRVTIATTAITMFGVVMGWIVTEFPKYQPDQTLTQPLVFLIPIKLLIVLAFMMEHCQTIVRHMHIISVYMTLMGLSEWEENYQKFAEKNYSPENKELALFGLLGGVTFLLPFLLYVLYFSSKVTYTDCTLSTVLFNFFLPYCLNDDMKYIVIAFYFFTLFYFLNFFRLRGESDYSTFRKGVKKQWKEKLGQRIPYK